MIIDTHSHLYYGPVYESLPDVLARAAAAGVQWHLMPNVDSTTVEPMLAIETQHSNCLPMMGLHPCHVKENYQQELAIVEQWLSQRSFFGLGEIGLDYYWDTTFVEEQKEALRTQLSWAKTYQIPAALHTRSANEDSIALVKEAQDGRLSGVFHCFSGTEDEARAMVDLGFYLGIGGVVTFKNGGIEPAVRAVGLKNLVLETDTPYLAPVPFRGKTNEPCYLTHVVDKLALIFETSAEEVQKITTANAAKLFNLRVL